ncbi:MAG: hypothetical protein E7079_06180 [Bacteroidales bacterium]|nr:hypothetical protein [Bacteroidales bacterium]
MSKILPPQNNINDICDDDIRIVGDIISSKSSQETLCHEVIDEKSKYSESDQSNDAIIVGNHKDNLIKRKKKNNIFLSSCILIGIIVVVLCCWSIFVKDPEVFTMKSLALADNANDRYLYQYCDEEIIDVDGLKLRIVTPYNSVPSLEIGHDCLSDTTSICIVQAASIAIDKDGNSSVVGAMVKDGKPISWGRSKAGYCAIIDDSIHIGASKHTYLFEQATERGGDFFRQYSLVENGKLSSMKNQDRYIRHALCVRNGRLSIVASVDSVVLNDFTKALIKADVEEAIMLEGGDPIFEHVDLEGKRHNYGVVDYPYSNAVSYLVWR